MTEVPASSTSSASSTSLTLAALLDAYLAALVAGGYSAATVVARRHDLRPFLRWCAERSVRCVAELTRGMVAGYQRRLADIRREDGAPLSLHTQRNALTSLRSFARWLVGHGHALMDVTAGVALPHLGDVLPRTVLSVAEVARLLHAPAADTPQGIRDRALFVVLYAAGLTSRVAARLLLSDVDLPAGTLTAAPLSAGQATRTVPLDDAAASSLRRYLDEVRPGWARRCLHRDRLFLGQSGKPLHTHFPLTRLHATLIGLGLPTRGGTYLLRHARAAHLLDAGADLRHVAALLGHANLGSAEVYRRLAVASLQAVHRQCHPAEQPAGKAGEDRTSSPGSRRQNPTAEGAQP